MLLLVAALAQQPAGLAVSAIADTSFTWIRREAPGFRAWFAAGSYPAAHQDSLLARLEPALANARRMIDAPERSAPIDVFFIESREQMGRLTGAGVTGFAHVQAGAVFLVTNPEWRAFERHEIAHVVIGQHWGPVSANGAWLQEGLAQAADGRCGAFSNTEVAFALAERGGWIPLDSVLHAFRRQADLRAYLQAASFVRYLLDRHGPEPLRDLWRNGASVTSRIGGRSLADHERDWRIQARPARVIPAEQLARIESHGCG